MTIPDEKLMAYADGELDAAQRAEVEAAMAADAEVARRVEQHRALRKQLNTTFDRVLLETVPDRLVAAARSASAKDAGSAARPGSSTSKRPATVTDLRRVRAARAAEAAEAAAAARRSGSPKRPWTWVEWGAMAASLAGGAIIAVLVMKSPAVERIGTRGGQLVAQSDLAQALNHQLASDQSDSAPVQIGVSFRTKGGEYCRTFVVRNRTPLGGMACKKGDAWNVQVLANSEGGRGGAGTYRTAGAELPAAVMGAVQGRIEGEAFDAEEEAAARDRNWK